MLSSFSSQGTVTSGWGVGPGRQGLPSGIWEGMDDIELTLGQEAQVLADCVALTSWGMETGCLRSGNLCLLIHKVWRVFAPASQGGLGSHQAKHVRHRCGGS